MGLDTNAVQLLIAARKMGVDFGRTMMIGRQNLNVPVDVIYSMIKSQGLPIEKFKKIFTDAVYAEPVFETLGATEVHSLDNSDFEGAKYIHDLNFPIPSGWKEQFDTVYDGGTIEHVFHFPNALKNLMELLRVNGRVFIHTCANNACGHGFYQFSPEVFFRAFSPENGFEIERLILHRTGPYGRWHEVVDPDAIRERVELISFTPIQIFVQAKRTKIIPIFSKAPQQTVYSDLWKVAEAPQKDKYSNILFAKLFVWLHPFKTALEFYRRQSLRNRRYYKSLKKFW